MAMIEMIQPGWLVVDSSGDEVGRVIDVEGDTIRVHKSGLSGGEIRVPKSACSYAEEGRVELSKRRNELG